ncbi:MAG: hypothetical protein QOJ45_1722 [Verrucomicrobiota bacterium]
MPLTADVIRGPSDFPEGSEIVHVDYTLGRLAITVEDLADRHAVDVVFADTVGFRVLDERDLLEFWPVCSRPNGWLFRITAGGWLAQETSRPTCLIQHMERGIEEYFLVGTDDCVSVISREPPTCAPKT